MIKTDRLCFAYGKKQILTDINLSVSKGEVLSLLGPNGSGKTTLLRLILNILKPTSGMVTIDGENTRTLSRACFPKVLAYVPQHISNKFPMTVFDTVLMGRRAYIHWAPSRKDLEAVEAVLARLKLEEIAMQDMTTLSGGQRQRVILARAIAQESDFILLDEPTSNLDLRHQFETMAILKELAAEGKGILTAMHDLQLAAKNTDRAVILDGGLVYSDGNPLQIINSRMLDDVYHVQADVLNDKQFSINIYGVKGG